MQRKDFLKSALCLAIAAGLGIPAATAGAAQSVDFAGKRVELVVPFPPGGGSDVYARALAPYIEKNLPGKPSIVVRNVPGGGSITGANHFHSRSRPDGLHALVVSASTVMNFVFQRSKMQLELNKVEPILLSPQGSVFYVSPSLGIKGPEDIGKLKGQSLVFGGGGPTGSELQYTTAFELLGLDVKYVWGVARGPTRLAFERGELNINYDTTPGFTKNASQLVKAGKAIPVFTLGTMDEKGNIIRDPNFPDLPSFPEAYEKMHGKKPSGAAFEAWKALFNMGVTANKAIVLPAGTPKPIVEAWRSALQKALADPGFQKFAANTVGSYPQVLGEAANPIIKEATTLSPEVWAWLKNFLKTKHGTDI